MNGAGGGTRTHTPLRTRHFECRTSANSVTPAGDGIVRRKWRLGDPGLIPLSDVKRSHRRLFRINDRIAKLDAGIETARAELEYHRSINEDAQRDAAVGNYIDREEAGATAADVRRFEKTIAQLSAKRERLVEKRDHLLAMLGD